MFKKYLAIPMGLLMVLMVSGFSGCQSMKEKSYNQEIASACATASAAQKVMLVANEAGRLSESAQDAYLKYEPTVSSVCDQDTASLDALQQKAFDEAVKALQAEAAKL